MAVTDGSSALNLDEDGRCQLTELLPEECSHCKPPEAFTWSAKFEGICTYPTCNQVIEVGERLRWNVEGTRAVHARHR